MVTHVAACVVPVLLLGMAGDAAAEAQNIRSDERARLDSNLAVVRQDAISGSPWPRVSIRRFLLASPREAAAVFIDYERHATYIPGLAKSAVSRRVTPRVTEVDYVLRVPLFPDEWYTVRDSLSASYDETVYRVEWSMVRARSTKAIVGYAAFEPYDNARTGQSGTLVSYVNLVVPGQRLAAPLRGRAIRQVEETLSALIREIERVRTTDPLLLDAQVAALRAAVADSTGSRRP